MLNGMEVGSDRYNSLTNAIANLEQVLSGDPGQSEVINAMSRLTRAMAGLE